MRWSDFLGRLLPKPNIDATALSVLEIALPTGPDADTRGDNAQAKPEDATLEDEQR